MVYNEEHTAMAIAIHERVIQRAVGPPVGNEREPFVPKVIDP